MLTSQLLQLTATHRQQKHTYNHTYILNSDRTTCTVLTLDTTDIKPNLKINNTLLVMHTHPKILGHTFDPINSLATYTLTTQKPKHPKLYRYSKVLSLTRLGKPKETLISTYKAVTRPILEYPQHYKTTNYTKHSRNNMLSKTTNTPHIAEHTKTLHLHASNKHELHKYYRIYYIPDHQED